MKTLLVIDRNDVDLFIAERVCKVGNFPYRVIKLQHTADVMRHLREHPGSRGIVLVDLDTLESCGIKTFREFKDMIGPAVDRWTFAQLYLFRSQPIDPNHHALEKPFTLEYLTHLNEMFLKKNKILKD